MSALFGMSSILAGVSVIPGPLSLPAKYRQFTEAQNRAENSIQILEFAYPLCLHLSENLASQWVLLPWLLKWVLGEVSLEVFYVGHCPQYERKKFRNGQSVFSQRWHKICVTLKFRNCSPCSLQLAWRRSHPFPPRIALHQPLKSSQPHSSTQPTSPIPSILVRPYICVSKSDPISPPSLNHSLNLFSNDCSESGTVWGLSGISQSFYTPHESLNHSLFSQITMMAEGDNWDDWLLQTLKQPTNQPTSQPRPQSPFFLLSFQPTSTFPPTAWHAYCVPSILPSGPYPPAIHTPLLPSLYLSPAVFSSGFSNPCRYVPRIISRTGLGHPRMMCFHHCGCSWSIEDGHLFVSGWRVSQSNHCWSQRPLSPVLHIILVLALHLFHYISISLTFISFLSRFPPLTFPPLRVMESQPHTRLCFYYVLNHTS